MSPAAIPPDGSASRRQGSLTWRTENPQQKAALLLRPEFNYPEKEAGD
jgi:hypothetical protein